MKKWLISAIKALEASLGPVPHEPNELDWKQNLSPKKNRLTQHLSAFANYPNGGISKAVSSPMQRRICYE